MHPEIEKFWEDQGYSIVLSDSRTKPDPESWRFMYFLMIDNRYKGYVAYSERYYQSFCYVLSPKAVKYLLDGRYYSEEEMLRFIRLKAFL